MNSNMSNFILPFCFGSVILFGTTIGLPDVGWIGLVVAGTYWLNSKFNKLERRIDNLPCNRCPVDEPRHSHHK